MQGRKTEGEERPKEEVARSRKQTIKQTNKENEFCMEKCAHAGDGCRGKLLGSRASGPRAGGGSGCALLGLLSTAQVQR